MLSISVTGENDKEGQKELREFDKFLNRIFNIKRKSLMKFTKIDYCKGRYLNTNRTTINREVEESNLLQAVTSTAFAVPIQDATYGQQQSNIIHQANAYQGVNLIYAVDT